MEAACIEAASAEPRPSSSVSEAAPMAKPASAPSTRANASPAIRTGALCGTSSANGRAASPRRGNPATPQPRYLETALDIDRHPAVAALAALEERMIGPARGRPSRLASLAPQGDGHESVIMPSRRRGQADKITADQLPPRERSAMLFVVHAIDKENIMSTRAKFYRAHRVHLD